MKRSLKIDTGFFGFLGKNGVVKRVKLLSVNVSGWAPVAGIVAFNCGSVNSCFVSGIVTGEGTVSEIDSCQVGGLVSRNGLSMGDPAGTTESFGPGFISDSISACTVHGISSIGGCVGQNWHGSTVNGCQAFCDVAGMFYVGGFVGTCSNSSTVTNCAAYGAVSGDFYVGGFTGNNGGSIDAAESSICTITHCSASGDVSGNVNGIGGFAGCNRGDSNITDSCAFGTVRGTFVIGGFVGYNGAILNDDRMNPGHIERCFSIGGVVGRENCAVNAGGFVGYSRYGRTITNCYARGAVDENCPIGNSNYILAGFCAWNDATSKISYCYTSGDVDGYNGGRCFFSDFVRAGFIGCLLYTSRRG